MAPNPPQTAEAAPGQSHARAECTTAFWYHEQMSANMGPPASHPAPGTAPSHPETSGVCGTAAA